MQWGEFTLADIHDRFHLFVRQLPTSERFTSIQSGGSKQKSLKHDRAQHGKRLLQELAAAVNVPVEPAKTAVRVEFQSEPDFDLALKSLDTPTHGLELLCVREQGQVSFATVLVQRSGISRLKNLIEQYTSGATQNGKPKNQALVDSIAKIRRAVLESLWTEVDEALPPSTAHAWFEIWLVKDVFQREAFRARARKFELSVAVRELDFIDRVVLLVGGQTERLEAFTAEDMSVAEVRLAKWTAADFMDLPNREKVAWAEELARRVVAASDAAPAVCVLDTGVNRGHLLLQPHIAPEDVQACHPDWGAQDHHGHGTMMAGLALYGDLMPLLQMKEGVRLTHRVESVKILPPGEDNAPEVWGAITTEAIARAETQAPDRLRVSCLAVTADERDRGQPSSWSAALDQFTSGMEDGQRRLVCVSAGNMNLDDSVRYPEANETASVHDPAQSWNALTVGAVADRDIIMEQTHQGWSSVASMGGLCPMSTTSLV